ncbi:hypothetical protein CAEBREN_28915 [Caenorhabditis brenneri]|uniref:Uncharacterized protein n=1 Tax=Caenorhabditis brenneri TaxID=135651 RepID=G0ML06_CAEBE|nr:hypothetical protein CAEBREN_28915 [Caenorhabditis brenneri]
MKWIEYDFKLEIFIHLLISLACGVIILLPILFLTMWSWAHQLWIFLTCQKGDGFIQLSQAPQYPVILKEDEGVDSMEDARRVLQPPKWTIYVEYLDGIMSMASTVSFYIYTVKECLDGENGRSNIYWENIFASATYLVFYHAIIRTLVLRDIPGEDLALPVIPMALGF